MVCDGVVQAIVEYYAEGFNIALCYFVFYILGLTFNSKSKKFKTETDISIKLYLEKQI
jgi:hypothetical protein